MKIEFHSSVFVLLPELHLPFFFWYYKYVPWNIPFSLLFAKFSSRILQGRYFLFLITPSCFQLPHKSVVIGNTFFDRKNKYYWDMYKHSIQYLCYCVVALLLFLFFYNYPIKVLLDISIVTFQIFFSNEDNSFQCNFLLKKKHCTCQLQLKFEIYKIAKRNISFVPFFSPTRLDKIVFTWIFNSENLSLST